MNRVPHIVWALLALVIVLTTYVLLVLLHGTTPKLMDGALLLIGAVAGLARGDVPPGTDD